MACTLASTGSPLAAQLGLAAILLLTGVALALVTRTHHGRRAAIVLLVVVGGGLAGGLGGAASAHAAVPGCTSDAVRTPTAPGSDPDANDSLRIVQTSILAGLAPGVAPVPITGTITNVSPTNTFVTAVTVSIVAVTVPGPGPCDASNYILLAAAMPVGQVLAPGGSADFMGARIGFNDKTINQDACKSALIRLRYASS